MPHYYLEGFKNNWKIVRETSSSQKFRVKTPDDYEFAIDIHYTSPKVLTVNVVFVGNKNTLSKSILTPVFDELARIALKRSDYAVIDYTLAHADKLFDGNYSIDEKDRECFS
ncbi:MAG: hypothetical protein ISS16_11325 [Ignavibacteria bacterium]|nr:hypothetical protein [Ignavibacteria bacterium]